MKRWLVICLLFVCSLVIVLYGVNASSDRNFFMPAELGGVKILIFLRDPIDWSWSFARMSLIKNRSVSGDELKNFFLKYKNYYPTVAAIDRWKKCFPQDQIFIGFFDKLCEAPGLFYKDICNFIDVEPKTPDLRPVNQGPAMPMPAEARSYLQDLWLPVIEQLCQHYSPYPQKWKSKHMQCEHKRS